MADSDVNVVDITQVSSSDPRNVRGARTRTLKIDNVVSSQRELGPAPPDGGYGWIILAVSAFMMVFIPSIQAAYGILLLFSRIELENSILYIWDIEIAFSGIFFTAFWTLTDPWSETVIQINQFPRFLSLSATSIFCSGILLLYFAKLSQHHAVAYMFAGAFSGIGASFAIQQVVTLIHKYFLKKIRIAKFVLHVANMMGFMLILQLIQHFAFKSHITESILDYMFITIAMLLAAILFENPKYISENKLPSLYTLLENTGEDEENIFDKNHASAALQNNIQLPAVPTTNVPFTDQASAREHWVTFSDIVSDDEIQEPQNNTLVNVECHPEPEQSNSNNNIASNNTPASNEPITTSEARTRIQSAFKDLTTDIERVIDHSDTPRPLFNNNQQLRENSSFSYDNNQVYNTITETITSSPSNSQTSGFRELKFLLVPTFYKSLFTVLVNKLSWIAFWTLFPTFIYNQVDGLHARDAIHCMMTVIVIGGILGMMPTFFIIPREKINFMLSITFFLGALGFDIITVSYSRNWAVLGGVLTLTSISTGAYMCEILIHEHSTTKTKFKTLLKTLVGILIIVIMVPSNMEYKFFYRTISLLQFTLGSIWLSNILFKKIKARFVR